MDKSEHKGFAYENALARQILAAQGANKQEALKSQLVSIMTRNSRELHQLVPQKQFDEAYFNSYWAAAFSEGLTDFAVEDAGKKAITTIRDCIWGRYVAPLSDEVSLDFVNSWQKLPAATARTDAAEQVAAVLCLAGELRRRQEQADEKKINQTNFIKYKEKLLATAEKCRQILPDRREHFASLLAVKPLLPLQGRSLRVLAPAEKETFLALYLRFSQIHKAFAKGEEGDGDKKTSYDGLLFSINYNKTKLIYAADELLPLYASRTPRPVYLGMSFYNMFFMFYRKAASYRVKWLSDTKEQQVRLLAPSRIKKLHDYLLQIYYANKEKVDAYYAAKNIAVSKDISNKARNLDPDNDNAWQLLLSWGVADAYPDAREQIAAIKQSVDMGYDLQEKKRLADYVLRLQSLEACRKQLTPEAQDYWAYRLSLDMYREFGIKKQRGLGKYQSKWFKTRLQRIVAFYIENANPAADREEIINSYLESCGKSSVDSNVMQKKYLQALAVMVKTK